MGSQASRSISNKFVFCLRQDSLPDICDVINDSEAWESYLKNHKRCFNCLREDHLSSRWLKTKGCYYYKGIHNSAIFNKREEKETMETT